MDKLLEPAGKKRGFNLKEKAGKLAASAKGQVDQLASSAKEQVDHLVDRAKEKLSATFDEWLQTFPLLDSYGLKVSSFGMLMNTNPSMEIELKGDPASFTPDRITEILDANKSNKPLTAIFKAIQMAYSFHTKIGAAPFDVVYVKVAIRLIPEVQVFLGKPSLV